MTGEKDSSKGGKTQKYAHTPQALSYDCVFSEVVVCTVWLVNDLEAFLPTTLHLIFFLSSFLLLLLKKKENTETFL